VTTKKGCCWKKKKNAKKAKEKGREEKNEQKKRTAKRASDIPGGPSGFQKHETTE